MMTNNATPAERLLAQADLLRQALPGDFRDTLVQTLYHEAESMAEKAVQQGGRKRWDWDSTVDRLLTSPIFGLPLMLAILSLIFWLTIAGANVPSAMLAEGFFWVEAQGVALFTSLGIPWWITGFLWDGVFRGLGWVISVMLPPMAIFFPLFTFLEDLGYLPRVAFNMDWLFKKAGAHGKQSLTMAMGFGCNAAGIIATRVIDSPRERLIAILTNNFVPCNGRFPTLIMLATVFVAASFPPALTSVIAAGSVVTVVVIGIIFTLVISGVLSRTVLRGEASAFSLELPPFRRPNLRQILYTSLIDRTIFVLWRAIQTAAPAGAAIWLLANIYVGDTSLAWHVANALQPLGNLVGLDGVILLAYIIAIPANEIVVPTMMMMYLGVGMMTDMPAYSEMHTMLVGQYGWTTLTAVNLMLFSLLHNPCATTIMTMWKETRSLKWTTLGALGPLVIAFAVTFLVAVVARAFGLG
ncbi:MAG TPA: nucleoside recognition domain-containing protein [Anaerolineales bacterium]|nr:nucleoside recognition domain-containing protein [Anaerolineales bacterium]